MSPCPVRAAAEAVVSRIRTAAKVAKVRGEEVSFIDAVPAMVRGMATADADSAAVMEQVYAPVVQEAERL